MKWGILGASRFALNHMAPAIHRANGAQLVAIATSDPAKAAPFAELAPGVEIVQGYDALLADPAIDAVYIPLPNHLHVPWTRKALAAGKHVLCEKPTTLQASEFDALEAEAAAAGKLCAEAYMIVHHPQFLRARELVQGGAIGKLMHVDCTFTFNNAADTDDIRNKPETGGGGLRDIGVYAFGAARFVSGQEPRQVTHADLTFENGVDTIAHVVADFGSFSFGGMVSIRMQPRQTLTFHGDTGFLTLTCPFNAGVHDVPQLILENDGQRVVTERWPEVNQYVLQVENFMASATTGAAYPCPLSFSRGTQEMMDKVFAAGQTE